MEANIYVPTQAKIERIDPLSGETSLFTLRTREKYRPNPGQFFMVSVTGSGEVPISVASSTGEQLSLCIKKAGRVTSAIHGLKEGDTLGIRGPYGNGFPSAEAKGKDLVLVAGGIGIAPLRPIILDIARSKKSYGKIFVLYGAKTPREIIFREEMDEWGKAATVLLTVDKADRKWKGRTGVVTRLIEDVKADFSRAVAFVCGPEIMIKVSMNELSAKGMRDEAIFTSLEAHMKCGVGKCGHCYIGGKFLCTDGPVFTLKELRDIRAGAFRVPHTAF